MTATTVEAVAHVEAPVAAKADPLARFKSELAGLEKSARAAAEKRLKGSKVEQLIEKLPGQLEGELDALLDRVGLVRKARLEIVKEDAVASAEAVVAEVVADVAAAAKDVDSAVEAEAPKKKAKKS